MTDENDNNQTQFRTMTVSRDFKQGIQPLVRLYEQYKRDGTINKSEESRALLNEIFPSNGNPMPGVDWEVPHGGLTMSEEMLKGERIAPDLSESFYGVTLEFARVASLINDISETEDKTALRVLSSFISSALATEQMKSSEMVTSLVSGLLSAIDCVEDTPELSSKQLAKVFAFQARSMVGKDNASGVKLVEGYAGAKVLFDEWVKNPKKYRNKSKFYLALISCGYCENTSTGERWIKDFMVDLDPCCPLGQLLLKKR
jgi:hypothetical protein